jgi:hypothetical protein
LSSRRTDEDPFSLFHAPHDRATLGLAKGNVTRAEYQEPAGVSVVRLKG